ncbi:MAG: anti-sigma factor domain-containing protein [Pseudonocardiaceae bacterium]
MNVQDHVSGCPHRELAVGWALHTLEPAEESLVALHLADCSECTCTVAETEQIGAALGLSMSEVAIPSAGLEQRVLAVTNVGAGAPVIPLVQPPRGTGNVLRLRYRALAAAAGVMLVAASMVLGIRVMQLGDQRDQAVQQVTAMAEAMRRAADPASVRVPLVTSDGRSVGMVLAKPNDVAVVATGLPSNRVTDQTYVLWGLGGGAPTPLRGFDVVSHGPVLHPVGSVLDAGEFTGYAISLEPGRHLPAAPTDVVASGKVGT